MVFSMGQPELALSTEFGKNFTENEAPERHDRNKTKNLTLQRRSQDSAASSELNFLESWISSFPSLAFNLLLYNMRATTFPNGTLCLSEIVHDAQFLH